MTEQEILQETRTEQTEQPEHPEQPQKRKSSKRSKPRVQSGPAAATVKPNSMRDLMKLERSDSDRELRRISLERKMWHSFSVKSTSVSDLLKDGLDESSVHSSIRGLDDSHSSFNDSFRRFNGRLNKSDLTALTEPILDFENDDEDNSIELDNL